MPARKRILNHQKQFDKKISDTLSMQNVVAKNLQEVLHKWFIFHFVLMDRRQISFRKLSEFEQNK